MTVVEFEGIPCGHKFSRDLDLTDAAATLKAIAEGCPVCEPEVES